MMTEYRYETLDSQGQLCSGSIEAASAPEAITALRAEGHTVYSVVPPARVHGFFRSRGRLTGQDIHDFNQIMVSLVKSGLPLPSGLASVARGTSNRRLKPFIEELHRGLNSGLSLDQAMVNAPGGLPPVYLNMIRAGEQTGNLPAVLALLARYSKQMLEFQGRLRMVLAYPIAVASILYTVVLFLSIFVTPQLAVILRELGAPLPLPTQLFLIIGKNAMPGTLAGMGVVIATFLVWRDASRRAEHDARTAAFMEAIMRRLPVLGSLHVVIAMGRFSRTLEILLKAMPRCRWQ